MSDIKLNTRYQIDTPTGFQPFRGVQRLTKETHYKINLSNKKSIRCSDSHRFIQNGRIVIASDLCANSYIDSDIKDQYVYIESIENVNASITLYDILEVNGGNLFYVDGLTSHNCDFSTSGDQVVHIDLLNFQKETHICDPIEKRGLDKDYWIFSPANYTRDYIISADCARGDGEDFSAFNIFDVETLEQVAEYKGKLTTKEYGNLLITAATEYNNALLIIENSNIGWATLQQVIDRGYENLFYNEMDVNIVEIEKQYTSKLNAIDKKSVPGFSTTSKSRPLIINKMTDYFNDRSIIIHSQRLYDELTVFIWNGAKAEAMKGYNDDLVMSLAIGLWIRDTALRIRSERTSYVKHMITGIQKSTNSNSRTNYGNNNPANSWNMKVDDKTNEDLTWLLG